MNVWDAIHEKRAVRQFTEAPLPEDAVERILRAGRRSQSSKNTQPWSFIAVRDRKTLEQLSQTGTYMGHVAGAALCIVMVTPEVGADHANWISFDVGQAAAYMQLAAQEIGVGSVLGAITEPDKARAVLDIPDGMRADAVVSFGYPTADEQNRPKRPGSRKPLDEIVHWDKW